MSTKEIFREGKAKGRVREIRLVVVNSSILNTLYHEKKGTGG